VKITVVGCGRLGAPYAVALAEVGHDVTVVEIDPGLLAVLRAGRCPFDEPGMDAGIRRNADAGRLRFTGSFDEAVSDAELVFLAVPTPQAPNSATMDLTAVEDSVRQVVRRLARDTVLIGKSTVPVGASQRMAALAADAAPAGIRVRVGWSPDFLREALSLETALHPARIVLGCAPGDGEVVQAVARRAWAPFLDGGAELLVTDFASADLAKSAANAFLAAKISFANLVDDVCRAVGADADTVCRSVGLDSRIGEFGLTPGLGWGGSCLGKDLRAFADRAGQAGVWPTVHFLRLVDEVNSARRTLAVEHAGGVLGSVDGATVAVWGASFKPGVGDISDSPALDVAVRLQRAGARVRIYDPSVNALVRRAHPALTVAGTARDAVEGARLLMVLTDWPEFAGLDPATLPDFPEPRTVVDARRCLDAQRWRSAGWHHEVLGYADARGDSR